MTKTGGEVEADVYAIIAASVLRTTITGTIYKEGTRPTDAKSEDAVVSFLTGLDDQIQTGVLNLNTYVQDIDNGGGQLVKNVARTRALESTINAIIQGLTPTAYRFTLGATIQTFRSEGTTQHFVNAKIKFQLTTF